MSESLKNKTVRGVGWSFADNISSAGVSFLVGLILANLLTPEEYGILAMIMIFIAVSNSIIDSGFSSALIRKIDCKPIDYNTTFYFNLGVSIVLYVILYVIGAMSAESQPPSARAIPAPTRLSAARMRVFQIMSFPPFPRLRAGRAAQESPPDSAGRRASGFLRP